MVEPTIISRSEHHISRRDIDSDAFKVLYRLHHAGFVAYLVGGSVRDLLLGRRPKDFDIGTSAHPYQVKKLFRNCWVIGRRFRLAHVKFGQKTIEVATFRRKWLQSEAPAEPEAVPARAQQAAPIPEAPAHRDEAAAPGGSHAQRGRWREHPHHRENTFGTPEEDAFRRDFTVNALFYDVGTLSIIDYVGGLKDLEARLVRCIGDPDERIHEDPVRMLRALVLAARLEFGIDPPLVESIAHSRELIASAAPARLLEEYYKILRSGVAERTFMALRDSGLLRHVTPELHRPPAALWQSLSALDAYHRRFPVAPDTLANSILVGTLLAPLGLLTRRLSEPGTEGAGARPVLGSLPVARRDVEQLRQILALQRRLLDLQAPPRVHRSLAHRNIFSEALTWLEIHGNRPDAVDHWQTVVATTTGPATEEGGVPGRRRRRRRRRRRPRRVAPGE